MTVKPPEREPIMEPRDTYLVSIINGKEQKQAIRPDKGDNTIRADHPEAIPFPPRKFVNIGHMCPKIADSPITGCVQIGVPKSWIYSTINKGNAALNISRAMANIPQGQPHARITLVAPVLPHAICLISIPMTILAMISPKDMEPSR